jgi:hypothetical protein
MKAALVVLTLIVGFSVYGICEGKSSEEIGFESVMRMLDSGQIEQLSSTILSAMSRIEDPFKLVAIMDKCYTHSENVFIPKEADHPGIKEMIKEAKSKKKKYLEIRDKAKNRAENKLKKMVNDKNSPEGKNEMTFITAMISYDVDEIQRVVNLEEDLNRLTLISDKCNRIQKQLITNDNSSSDRILFNLKWSVLSLNTLRKLLVLQEIKIEGARKKES